LRSSRAPARVSIAELAWGSPWYIATFRRWALSSKSVQPRAAARASWYGFHLRIWWNKVQIKLVGRYLVGPIEADRLLHPRRFNRRPLLRAKLPAASAIALYSSEADKECTVCNEDCEVSREAPLDVMKRSPSGSGASDQSRHRESEGHLRSPKSGPWSRWRAANEPYHQFRENIS
jgi:hypothetical protein